MGFGDGSGISWTKQSAPCSKWITASTPHHSIFTDRMLFLTPSCTATDRGPPTSANHCRTPSIRCAQPHGLELSAGRSPSTAGLRVL